MDIRWDNNILVVRLYAGENVHDSLKEALVASNKPFSSVVSAAGMMANIRIAYFKGQGEYAEKFLEAPHEVLSLSGNFVNSGEKFFSHLHVSLANSEFQTCGGHLVSAEVYGTQEIVIMATDIKAARRKEEETGLEGLKI